MEEVTPEQNLNYPGTGYVEEEFEEDYSKQRGSAEAKAYRGEKHAV